MAEPFSLGASIVGVIGLTIQIGELLVKFGKNWNNAPEDVKSFIIEIQMLKSTLSMTYANAITNPEFAKAMEGKESALLTHFAPLDKKQASERKMNLTIDTCKGRLEKLLAKLEKAAQGDQFGWNRLKVAFMASDIHDTVVDLHRQCQVLNNLVALDSLTLSMETLNEVRAARREAEDDRQTRQDWESRNDHEISELKDGLGELGHNDRFQEQTRILNLISTNTYASQQRDLLSKKTEGTGRWLLESEEYKSWLAGTGTTLFCYGIPGSGKTIMSSIVIDDLTVKNQDNSGVYLAYVFCNFRTQHEQTPENIFSSILRQLVQRQDGIPDYIKNLYSRDKNLPTLSQVKDAAGKITKDFKGGGYIIVDALDEFSVSIDILRRLVEQLFELQRDTGLRLFVTSRKVPIIEEMFVRSAKLEIRATDGDVEKYVQSRLPSMPRYVLKSQRFQERIQATIVKHVQGMFLLARLHLDSLMHKKSATMMKNSLAELDGGKYAYIKAYDKAMERIADQDLDRRDLAHQILYWVTFAKRPLKTSELQHALAVELDNFSSPSFDPDNITDLEFIVSVCAGLVTIDTETNIIRLVHHTTQQYFDRIKKDLFPRADWYIASVCMRYLSYQNVAPGAFSGREDHRLMFQNWPLFGYASEFWHEHIDRDDRSQDIPIRNFLEAADAATPAYQAAVIARYTQFEESDYYFVDWDFESEHAQQKRPIALHWTAFIGHNELTRTFLKAGLDAEQEDFEGMTPMMVAARRGHSSTVWMMLEEWRITAEPSHKGLSPLIYATTFDQEEVVKVLLQLAHMDAQQGAASLGQAVALGRAGIVKLLLADPRINPNVESPDGNSGLTIATKAGFTEIVQALLAVDDLHVNFTDPVGMTALHLAVLHDHEKIASLLLDDPRVEGDIKDDEGRTPLSLAIELGRSAIISHLLARPDVDPNAKDSKGRTLLILAAQNQDCELVSLLLRRPDIDVNARDANGSTALAITTGAGKPEPEPATTTGSEQATEDRRKRRAQIAGALLAAKDADPELKDNRGWAPLFHAAARGHTDILSLLLGPLGGVSADRLGPSGRTALFHARTAATARVLVEAGRADLEWRDAEGLTPAMSHYFRGGGGEVFAYLCAQGADLQGVEAGSGDTLLLRAAARGDAPTVRVLLASGADANHGGGRGGSALLEALRESPKTVSDAFVEALARFRMRGDDSGGKEEEEAAKAAKFEFEFDKEVPAGADPGRRYRAIVGLLLKWGADRDAISQLDLLRLRSKKASIWNI